MHQCHSDNANQFEREPLITIITVVINGEDTIESTIQSVLNQSDQRRNINYIVIDGNSEDNTVNILKKYDDKITCWISEPDRGIYDAMNKGWNMAKDSYILFLGSGDKILQLPELNNYSKNSKEIYFGKVLIGAKPFKSRLNFRFKMGNTLHHQALLVPKSACKYSPFDLQYKVYADYDFSIKLLKDNYNFIYCDDFSSVAAPDGLSSIVYIGEILNIVKKEFGYMWMFLALLFYVVQITRTRLIKKQECRFSFR
jgi:glycosyltransferase involved in cell wall biosynthesis